MEVRDAGEDDAAALGGLGRLPAGVWRDLVHDRTVRVADGGSGLCGVVSFDARHGAVHVTQLCGEPTVYERLLAEPVRFAKREALPVRFLISADDEIARDAARAAGFEAAGSGPPFEGTPTTVFRLVP